MTDKRAAYFGTNGRAGHFLYPLHGDFSSQEVEELSYIDLVPLRGRGGMFSYKGFTCLYLPYSPDDKRLGSKSIVMVENGDIGDIKNLIMDTPWVSASLLAVIKKYEYTERELISIFGDGFFVNKTE